MSSQHHACSDWSKYTTRDSIIKIAESSLHTRRTFHPRQLDEDKSTEKFQESLRRKLQQRIQTGKQGSKLQIKGC